jgi:hypothetical protein
MAENRSNNDIIPNNDDAINGKENIANNGKENAVNNDAENLVNNDKENVVDNNNPHANANAGSPGVIDSSIRDEEIPDLPI